MFFLKKFFIASVRVADESFSKINMLCSLNSRSDFFLRWFSLMRMLIFFTKIDVYFSRTLEWLKLVEFARTCFSPPACAQFLHHSTILVLPSFLKNWPTSLNIILYHQDSWEPVTGSSRFYKDILIYWQLFSFLYQVISIYTYYCTQLVIFVLFWDTLDTLKSLKIIVLPSIVRTLVLHINPFLANVFKGYKMGTLAKNGLTPIYASGLAN